MEAKTSISNLALIWGNLRNVVDFKNIIVPGYLSLIGSSIGEFPIESYNPIYLEMPKEGTKFDLSGRHNWPSKSSNRKIDWTLKRLIQLPDYDVKENIEIIDLKAMFQKWNKSHIPDNIPCFNLATSTKGTYCSEGREGQIMTVLLLWPSGITRMLQLDCFEGALDDCCTPEWYIKSFKIATLGKATKQLLELYNSPSDWEFPRYSIYLNPPCYKLKLNGKKEIIKRKGWPIEWVYKNHSTFFSDLKLIIKQLEILNY